MLIFLVRRDSQEAAEDQADEKQLRRERQESRIQDVESNLGTKIKAALIKPIEVMKAKVQGPFEKIMNALKSLFMGFVGMKAIDALKAWAEGDTETLDKLKNDLIQALAVGAGVFVALNGGIGLILGAAGALGWNYFRCSTCYLWSNRKSICVSWGVSCSWWIGIE